MNDENAGDYYKKRALKRLAIIVGAIIIVGGVWWSISRSDSLNRIASLETSAQQIAQETIVKNFSAPVPLVSTSTRTGGSSTKGPYALTRAGVIADTNTERAENGSLPPLVENTTLDQIASLRLADMFARQYFAHVSPPDANGVTSSALTVTESVGYDYIALGENLALGNFLGDQGVVTAWMNSPGHRANILDTHYTEIGVAVGNGLFEGERAWIAVQVFGRPASDCPSPDPNLQMAIDNDQAKIATLEAQLQTERVQIVAAQSNGTTNTTAYQQEIDSYNADVKQYNTLTTQTQTEITQYNAAADAYNVCIGVTTTTATSSR